MDFILAAVLEVVVSDRIVAEAIADSSCAECRKFQASILPATKTESKIKRERFNRCRTFRIKSKGGCCG